ncbi:hypothetical protein BGZ63DRAFT_141740 [Mariannaea sp. PMI_226]|nr:hypothetical protein BGZ63DRAFT_141740 [Mariannaea sp. PMI_226]
MGFRSLDEDHFDYLILPRMRYAAYVYIGIRRWVGKDGLTPTGLTRGGFRCYRIRPCCPDPPFFEGSFVFVSWISGASFFPMLDSRDPDDFCCRTGLLMIWLDRRPDSKVSYTELVYNSQLFSQRIITHATFSPPLLFFLMELFLATDIVESLCHHRID